MLAKSKKGYENLVIIANKINKGINLNINKKINIEFLIKHRFGLIILSGGYQNGFIGTHHKNHKANLANVCKPCHIHVTKNKII